MSLADPAGNKTTSTCAPVTSFKPTSMSPKGSQRRHRSAWTTTHSYTPSATSCRPRTRSGSPRRRPAPGRTHYDADGNIDYAVDGNGRRTDYIHDAAGQPTSDYAAVGVGIEGVVIKGLPGRPQPGRRGWLKLRIQVSVGAVGGRPAKPQRLLLGLLNTDGELELIGTTGLLSDKESRAVGELLQPMGTDHPWPADITPGGFAALSARERPLPITRVDPTLVSEVKADAANQHGQFRHIAALSAPAPTSPPPKSTTSPIVVG